MNTSANEGVKNRQKRRLIWILIAGVGLAIFIFLAILYSGRQSETPTIDTAETTPVRAESIGVRPPSFRQITEFSENNICLLYTSPSPRDRTRSRMPSSA